MNNKGFAPVVLIIVVAALLAIGIGGYVFLQQKDNTPPPTVSDEPIITLPPVAPTSSNSEVVKPAAPGPFVADAVRGLMPKTLRVGSNEIVAEVRGYMFFEGETRLALYDGTKEINIGTRPDGLPNTVVSAQGEWMTENYVPVRQTITIPTELKGKTLVIRFIANDPSDNAKPRYWGTLINVIIDYSETANWKTYTNVEYGFSFKYPPSFTFKSAGETVTGVAPHQWWATFRNVSERGSLGLFITENTPVDVNARTIAQGPGGENQVSTKQVMVGTKTGIQFDASYEGESSTGVRVPLGNHLLGISFSSLKGDMFYADSVLIEQILSTFLTTDVSR